MSARAKERESERRKRQEETQAARQTGSEDRRSRTDDGQSSEPPLQRALSACLSLCPSIPKGAAASLVQRLNCVRDGQRRQDTTQERTGPDYFSFALRRSSRSGLARPVVAFALS